MYGNNPRIYLNNGEKITAPAPNPNAVKLPEFGHQISWTEACKAGFNSKEHKALSSSFDYSGPLTETVLMGNLAIRFPDRKLLWDGEKMQVTNDKAANAFVHRQYREGYTL